MANAANYFKVCSSALGLAKLHENQNRKILKPSLCPSILSTLEWLIKVLSFLARPFEEKEDEQLFFGSNGHRCLAAEV